MTASRPTDPEELAWLIENGEDPGPCATLPPMPTPLPPAPPLPSPPSLLQLTVAAVRSTLNSTGSWERLPTAERRAAMARLRFELEAVAKKNGTELAAMVSIQPHDPPPSEPAP